MILRRLKPRRGRILDPKFLKFVRTQPCSVPGCKSEFKVIEASHVGIRGLGQKCSDRESLPLCAAHHTWGVLSHHRLGKSFWRVHRLNRAALIVELNRLYEIA